MRSARKVISKMAPDNRSVKELMGMSNLHLGPVTVWLISCFSGVQEVNDNIVLSKRTSNTKDLMDWIGLISV